MTTNNIRRRYSLVVKNYSDNSIHIIPIKEKSENGEDTLREKALLTTIDKRTTNFTSIIKNNNNISFNFAINLNFRNNANVIAK